MIRTRPAVARWTLWHPSHTHKPSRVRPGFVYCLLCTAIVAINGQVTVHGDDPCPVKVRGGVR